MWWKIAIGAVVVVGGGVGLFLALRPPASAQSTNQPAATTAPTAGATKLAASGTGQAPEGASAVGQWFAQGITMLGGL